MPQAVFSACGKFFYGGMKVKKIVFFIILGMIMSGCSIYQEPEYTLQDLKEKLKESQNLSDNVENELKNLENEFEKEQQANSTIDSTKPVDKNDEDKQTDRNDLQKKVEEQLSEDEEVLKTNFTQLKNGKLSAVIVTGCPVAEDDEYATYPSDQKIWFVVDDFVTRLDDTEDTMDWSYENPEFITENEGTLLYTIKSNGSPYPITLMWRIVNDRPEFIEEILPWMTHVEGGEFEGINRVTASSVGGMNDLPCYFYWDGEEIREYGAVELNKEELLKLSDAKKYLDEIERIDGKVESILYQETKDTAYIYINYTVSRVNQERERTEEYYHSAYLSVDCETGKLTPIKVDNDSNYEILNSFLDECDYDAHFVKAVVPEIAVYPEKPSLFQNSESQTEVQEENKPASEPKPENAAGNNEESLPSSTEKTEEQSDKNITTGQDNLSGDEVIKQSWSDAKSGSPEKGRDSLEQMYNQTQDSTYLKERLSLCRTYGIPNWNSTKEQESFFIQLIEYLKQEDINSAERYLMTNRAMVQSLIESCEKDGTCTMYYQQTLNGKGLAVTVGRSSKDANSYGISLLYSSWVNGIPNDKAIYISHTYYPNMDVMRTYCKTTLTNGLANGKSICFTQAKGEFGYTLEGNVKNDFWTGKVTRSYWEFEDEIEYLENGRQSSSNDRDIGETVFGIFSEKSGVLNSEFYLTVKTGRLK